MRDEKYKGHEMNFNTDNCPTLDRNLERLEARVADLSDQIAAMRKDLSGISRTVDTSISAHRERLAALESFRRWAIGVLTGILLSGVAAAFAYAFRTS